MKFNDFIGKKVVNEAVKETLKERAKEEQINEIRERPDILNSNTVMYALIRKDGQYSIDLKTRNFPALYWSERSAQAGIEVRKAWHMDGLKVVPVKLMIQGK